MTDGVPEKKKGTLEDELLQNGKTNTSEVVERGTPQAKHASLSYEVVEQDGKHAVLRIKLDTGRHHPKTHRKLEFEIDKPFGLS